MKSLKLMNIVTKSVLLIFYMYIHVLVTKVCIIYKNMYYILKHVFYVHGNYCLQLEQQNSFSPL